MRRLGILLTPGVRRGGPGILADLVAMTQRYTDTLYGDVEPIQAVSLGLFTGDGHPVIAGDGTRLAVEGALADAALDGLYVADFEAPTMEGWPDWRAANDAAISAIEKAVRGGCVLACAGAGVILALEAGVGAAGPVAAPPHLVPLIRRGRKTAIDPTATVVQAGTLLSAAGLGAEPALALRLIERAVTPNLGAVLAPRTGIEPVAHGVDDDAFAVTVLRPDDLVARARQSMRARFSHSIDLAAFAAEMGVTPRTLSRRFHASVGMSPKAYQQHLRLAAAQSMLKRTTRPVARIAALVGYSDTPFFVALFQRRVGMTPAAFRRQARDASHP